MAINGSATSDCIETVRHTKVKVEENGRSAVFLNQEAVPIRRITVDGCLVTTGIRCDKLISHPTIVDVLVELKGSDVKHALEQIAATMEIWEVHQERVPGSRMSGLIVCSQVPRFNTQRQKLESRIASRFRAPIHITSRNQEHAFADLRDFR